MADRLASELYARDLSGYGAVNKNSNGCPRMLRRDLVGSFGILTSTCNDYASNRIIKRDGLSALTANLKLLLSVTSSTTSITVLTNFTRDVKLNVSSNLVVKWRLNLFKGDSLISSYDMSATIPYQSLVNAPIESYIYGPGYSFSGLLSGTTYMITISNVSLSYDRDNDHRKINYSTNTTSIRTKPQSITYELKVILRIQSFTATSISYSLQVQETSGTAYKILNNATFAFTIKITSSTGINLFTLDATKTLYKGSSSTGGGFGFSKITLYANASVVWGNKPSTIDGKTVQYSTDGATYRP